MRGQLIVIEGGDGSGKTTQSKLLVEYLKKKKAPVMYVDSPQYEEFFGKIVAKFLRGEFGSIQQTSPYLVSIIYALDRSTLREKMNLFLEKGGTIVANRYTTSNMAHQTANIEDEQKQEKFIRWIAELEYEQLRIPRETAVIYLYVPWQTGMNLSEQKLRTGNHHDYLEGKFDILEKDMQHRKDTEETYLRLSSLYKHWKKIDCVDKEGILLSPEQVHKKVLAALTL